MAGANCGTGCGERRPRPIHGRCLPPYRQPGLCLHHQRQRWNRDEDSSFGQGGIPKPGADEITNVGGGAGAAPGFAGGNTNQPLSQHRDESSALGQRLQRVVSRGVESDVFGMAGNDVTAVTFDFTDGLTVDATIRERLVLRVVANSGPPDIRTDNNHIRADANREMLVAIPVRLTATMLTSSASGLRANVSLSQMRRCSIAASCATSRKTPAPGSHLSTRTDVEAGVWALLSATGKGVADERLGSLQLDLWSSSRIAPGRHRRSRVIERIACFRPWSALSRTFGSSWPPRGL